MSWLAWIRPDPPAPPPPPAPDRARDRRDALAEAAIALARADRDGDVDPLLRLIVEAAHRIAGGGAALLLLGRDGGLERFAGEGLDGCTRETLARPDLLRALVARLDAAGAPLGPDDLDPTTAGMLHAVAPWGLFAVPVDRDAILVLVEASPEREIDADGVAVVTVLGRLAASAIGHARERALLRTSCEELRRLCADVLLRQEDEFARTAHELHEGICQRLAAANAQLEALAALVGSQRGALARLRDARALVNQTVGELREVAQRLRPSVLANLGYVEAVRWYLGRLRERAGVAPSLEVEGAETRLPLDVESALFRATETALGAATQAREPRRLRVRYRRECENVRIEIAGPPPEAVDMVALRERLRPFGGAVTVTAVADRPPVIELQVPAPPTHAHVD